MTLKNRRWFRGDGWRRSIQYWQVANAFGFFARAQKRIKAVPLLRKVVPLLIGVICLATITNRLDDMDMSRIMMVMAQVSVIQWVGAIAATAISFWAVGRYDAVIHRHWKTGYTDSAATLSGATSIAIAQTIGMGVFSGAIARWRMMPGLGIKMATKISTSVAVSFLAAWSVITALVFLCFGSPPNVAGFSGIIIVLPLIMAVILLAYAFWHPSIVIKGHRFNFPTLPAIGAIFFLTLLDTMAATAALQFLLPSTISIGIQTLFPVYLLALGAALISGTPGGVGPFELAMLALLPMVPNAEIIGAILAFRLIYYALPACIALIILARPPSFRPTPNLARLSAFSPTDAAVFTAARRAETGVARQTVGLVFHHTHSCAAILQTGQSLNILFDPVSDDSATTMASLGMLAQRHNKLFSMYKCGPRSAALLRNCGYKTLLIANEAVINPSHFCTNTSKVRQLRRKLRKAAKQNVEIEFANSAALSKTLLFEMAYVDRQWALKNGPSRGATMGQFCAKYLRHQQIFLARQNGNLVGFISLHTNAHERCLDLMRALPSAPDGTMHSLVTTAIQHAASEGKTRFSLAALPLQTPLGFRLLHPILQPLHRYIIAKSGNSGLVQFKSCFNPQLRPLYMVSTSWPAMALCLADIACAVHFTSKEMETNPIQHDYDELEFATEPNS